MSTGDLELLEIELETLWVTDERGRLLHDRTPAKRPAPSVVVASCADGWLVAAAAGVPDPVIAGLRETMSAAPVDRDTSGPLHWDELLEPHFGALEVFSGPSYLIPPGTSYRSSAAIVSSDADATTIGGLRAHNPPGANWTGEDWDVLLEGRFGPWAMATSADRVIALCHSARLGDRGAEAGVWTDPDFRGQGHAAAATAAWAGLVAPSGKVVYYSTSDDNHSSLRVAERLKLQRLGWLCEVYRTGDEG